MTAVYRDPQDRRLKLVLAVLLLILLLLQVRLWSGAGSLADIDRLQREIEQQQAENAGLLERNEALREEVSDLKTGLDSIEERARSELGLIRRGETFVLVVDAERDKAASDRIEAATDTVNTERAQPADAAPQDPSQTDELVSPPMPDAMP